MNRLESSSKYDVKFTAISSQLTNHTAYAPTSLRTYEHGKLDASPDESGNLWVRRDECVDYSGKFPDRLKEWM